MSPVFLLALLTTAEKHTAGVEATREHILVQTCSYKVTSLRKQQNQNDNLFVSLQINCLVSIKH